jgi:putative ABC transport system substrate-binding protein
LLIAGGALLMASFATHAQRSEKRHRVGFLSPVRRGPRDEAFVDELRRLGRIEGRDLDIELRFSDGRPERLPELVEELIRLNVDVLVVGATIGARAAKNATSTIPIVFAGSSDPIAGGIVTNLARPEGNITGSSLAIGEGFAGKWLEILKEVAPDRSHFAVIWSSSNAAAASFVQELQAAARKVGVKLDVHHAADGPQLDAVLQAIGRSDARALIVTPSPFAASQQGKLVQFAESKRLPAMYFVEDFVDAGGLISYGPSIVDAYRRAAMYVDSILKGAKPGDLPVEQSKRFELVVNRKTARTLALEIPGSVLVRADRVID